MKEENLVPKVRFKGFSDPWEQRKLNTIFDILDGDRGSNYPHESDFMKTGNTLFLDTGNVTKTGFNFKNKKYISKEKDGILRTGKLKVNDFIITSRGTLGNIAFYDDFLSQKYSSVRINSAMLILRPLPNNNVENVFVITQLRGNMVTSFLRRDHVGSAQPHITKHDFSKVEIIIPKNNMEQHEIGEEFKKMSQLIAANEDKLDQLKELKKLMMQKIFSQEWRFKGFTDPWEQRKLSSMATIQGGGTPSSSNAEYWNGEINWFTPTEVFNQGYLFKSQRRITTLGLEKSSAKILPVGTILFTSRAGVGDMGILTESAATNQGFQSIIPNEDVPSYFIFTLQPFISKQANRLASGSTFTEISNKSVGKIQIDVPQKLTEKRVIGQLFLRIDELIAANEEKLEQLKQLKKYLMQNMFV